MNIIYGRKNFLTENECDFLISYFKSNYRGLAHDGTHILPLNDSSRFHFKKSLLRRKIRNMITRRHSNLELNYDQIVKWPNGSFKDLHYDKDTGLPKKVDWTLVCYLNDDFSGGRTRVEETFIVPQKGKMTLFNSKNFSHGVEPVDGTRYTYIAWWQEN